MPARIELELAHRPGVRLYPARLHGAACALFETPESDHNSQHKPFTASPLVGGSRGSLWILGWLGETSVPSAGEVVVFGDHRCAVLGRRVVQTSYAELSATAHCDAATLELWSPAYFSRNGRDYPLPDPVLIVRGLVARWNQHCPAHLRWSEEVSRQLFREVTIAEMTGRTVRAQVTYTMEQIGFVGSVRLLLKQSATADVGVAFSALMKFAQLSGIGAQTTHGFGACRLAAMRQTRTARRQLQESARGARNAR